MLFWVCSMFIAFPLGVWLYLVMPKRWTRGWRSVVLALACGLPVSAGLHVLLPPRFQ